MIPADCAEEHGGTNGQPWILKDLFSFTFSGFVLSSGPPKDTLAAEQVMESRTVSEIMQSVPLSLLPETSSLRAEKILLLCQLPEVYVTSSEGSLLGVVPDYIFLKNRIIEREIDRPIRELMVPFRLIAHPHDSILKLACTLREHIHQRVPVVDRGLLVGMVTRHAVLRTLVEAVLESPDDSVETQQPGRALPASIPTPHMKPEREDLRQLSPLAVHEST